MISLFSSVSSTIFQFLLVRLKEDGDDSWIDKPAEFQFLLVRLKGIFRTNETIKKIISIPSGTIKSIKRFLSPNVGGISIPSGTIKRP